MYSTCIYVDIQLQRPKAQMLKDACRTRWIERIDSYTVFLELLPALHTSLQAMVVPRQYEDLGDNWSWDGNTVTKANGFLFQLQSPSFLICFKILLEILQSMRSLTLKLQMQTTDVVYAYKQVKAALSSLKKMRESSAKDFSKVFTETLKFGQELHREDFELTTPRIMRRQAVDYYKDDLLNQRMFSVEHRMWVRKWKQCSSSQGKVSRKMVDAFQKCDETEFPNISVLLKLALTLP